jgi:hypothetical protein
LKTVLTTADVAERKRFQFWQDAVCDTFVELDCETCLEETFFGEITKRAALQTADIARRLMRGGELHQGASAS